MAEQFDYYRVLGVSPTTTTDEMKAIRNAIVKRIHPDISGKLSEPAEAYLRRINEAYNVLSHPERKAAYDRLREQPQVTPEQQSQTQQAKEQAGRGTMTQETNAPLSEELQRALQQQAERNRERDEWVARHKQSQEGEVNQLLGKVQAEQLARQREFDEFMSQRNQRAEPGKEINNTSGSHLEGAQEMSRTGEAVLKPTAPEAPQQPSSPAGLEGSGSIG